MRLRTIAEMRAPDGLPVRVRDLAALTGFSKPKITADIHEGYLRASAVRCGRTHLWMISFAEAQRYLRDLSLLDIPQ